MICFFFFQFPSEIRSAVFFTRMENGRVGSDQIRLMQEPACTMESTEESFQRQRWKCPVSDDLNEGIRRRSHRRLLFRFGADRTCCKETENSFSHFQKPPCLGRGWGGSSELVCFFFLPKNILFSKPFVYKKIKQKKNPVFVDADLLSISYYIYTCLYMYNYSRLCMITS